MNAYMCVNMCKYIHVRVTCACTCAYFLRVCGYEWALRLATHFTRSLLSFFFYFQLGIYMNNMGDIERKRGNYQEALSIYKTALENIEHTLGATHSEAAEVSTHSRTHATHTIHTIHMHRWRLAFIHLRTHSEPHIAKLRRSISNRTLAHNKHTRHTHAHTLSK